MMRACLLLLAASGPALADGGSVAGKVEGPPRYLKETVVYVKALPGPFMPKTRPIDQKAMTFIPHVLTATAGDTAVFLNHDVVDHNVFSPDNEGFNLGVFPHGQNRSYPLRAPGVYVLLCRIHPDMLGYIFVGQNPFSTTVDAEGRFRLDKIPPGRWQLAVWNSHGQAPDQTVEIRRNQTARANFNLGESPHGVPDARPIAGGQTP